MKKTKKRAMDIVTTSATLGLGAQVVTQAGGNAAGLQTMSRYMPTMGSMAGASGALGMLGQIGKKRRK